MQTKEASSAGPQTRANVQTLERIAGIKQDEFITKYVNPRRPVILQDAISQWPAIRKWGADFWIETYGDRRVEIEGKEYLLRDVIRLALESTPETPAPYYRNVRLRLAYPELMADILPYPAVAGPNWFHSGLFFPIRNRIVGGGGHYELFIGGAGRAFPYLHYDAPGAHTFIYQLVGRKRFVLYSPEDGAYLYPKAENAFSVSEITDLDNPDLKKFPRFPKATRIECEIGAGDTLFMPCGWWHTAKMESFSVGLGIDVANRTNWDHVLGYMGHRASFENPALALAYMTYMRAAGAVLSMTS